MAYLDLVMFQSNLECNFGAVIFFFSSLIDVMNVNSGFNYLDLSYL